MERKNYYLLDIVKFISAIFVVGIHTAPFIAINETLNYFLIQIIGRIAVPFYFVASSFLFFRKVDYSIGLMAKDNIKLLKGFVFRILKLYMIWTLIYLVVLIYQWTTGGFDSSTLVRFARDIIFTGSYYHLWFLPAMIFSTVVVYFMIAKLKTLHILEIAVALYVIGMLINVYGAPLMRLPLLGVAVKSYLNIFSTARNGLFFGVMFTMIGAYIAHYNFKLNKKELLKRTLVCFALLFVEGFFIRGLQLNTDLTSMYLTLVPFMFYFFLYLLEFNLEKKEKYHAMRAYSTLIYLSHCFFIVILKALPFTYHNLVLFLLVFVLSFEFSYVVYLIAQKPKFKFLKVLY